MTAARLDETVIQGGFCIGCGTCAAQVEYGFRMTYSDTGTFRAKPVVGSAEPRLDPERFCPFSDGNLDEDELAQGLFPDADPHPRIGRFISTYAGAVAEGDYRARGSSGGLVTWLAAELLRSGTVDGVAHVRARKPTAENDRLFEFSISRTQSELRAGAKSRYYPVEMSRVLGEIASRPGRYLLVGLPCFIKAIRLLQRQQPLFAERIVVTIGLVCGHLKSAAFAEYLAWQTGVVPASLGGIDFRYKLPDRPANQYGVQIWSRQSRDPKTVPANELFGSDWGMGLFKYRACDFCDDVLAETADVSVGDAWLPAYVRDSRGTNVVVARTPAMAELLARGLTSGRLDLDQVSADEIAQSQTAGLRYRREGLAHRLSASRLHGRWHPPKRVKPGRCEDAHRAEIYALREELATHSHAAFKQAKERGRLPVVKRALRPWLQAYQAAYRPKGLRGLIHRLAGLIPRSLRKWMRRSRTGTSSEGP